MRCDVDGGGGFIENVELSRLADVEEFDESFLVPTTDGLVSRNHYDWLVASSSTDVGVR